MSEIKNWKLKSKEEGKEKIPKDATITSKEVSVTVEEIENGFLIIKRCDIRYKQKGKDYNDYHDYTEKTFSETNPFKPIIEEDKELADFFD